jgi:hypothetical protein
MFQQAWSVRPLPIAALRNTALAVAAGLALSGAAAAQKIALKAELTGQQEVPPVTTPAMGTAFFLIDLDADTVTFEVTLDELQTAETGAQIYGYAPQGQNGGAALFDLGTGNHKTGTWNYPPADEANILASLAYVNVQTTGQANGEIRGQITRISAPYAFVASLDGASEVPPVTTTAMGTGVFELDPVANTLSFQMTYADLSATETASHFHGYAPAGQNANIVFTLPMGFHKVGTWTYLQADEASILNGLLYSNVHSSTNTNGEIRGQIEVQATNPGSYCSAKPNSQACTPAVGWSSLPSLTGTDDYVVSATNVINNKNAVFMWSQIPSSTPFMGGTLCVDQATATVTGVQSSAGNPPPDDCSGTLSFAFNQAYMTTSGLTPGSFVFGQWLYRDPANPDGTGYGLTDAVFFEILN